MIFQDIKRVMDKTINYKWAMIAALVLGGIVFTINLSHGASLALVAAGKQATYTFFVAGFITRLCEVLAVKWDSPWLSLPLATVLPGSIAVGLTFLMHSMKGTPEPFLSTLPTMIMAPGFLGMALTRRRQMGAEKSTAVSSA